MSAERKPAAAMLIFANGVTIPATVDALSANLGPGERVVPLYYEAEPQLLDGRELVMVGRAQALQGTNGAFTTAVFRGEEVPTNARLFVVKDDK